VKDTALGTRGRRLYATAGKVGVSSLKLRPDRIRFGASSQKLRPDLTGQLHFEEKLKKFLIFPSPVKISI
jgi:hypothetical protein